MFSEFAIQFALQILLPAFLILDLLQGRYKSKLDWFIRVCVFGLAILFAFLTARWDLSSYYLRIIVPLLFLTASYIAFRRIRSGSSSSSRHVRWITLAPYVILIMALLWLNVNVLGGYFYSDSEEPVELSFPLRGGLYYVGGGGANRWINGHHAFPPQDYALDIVRLNTLGNRAFGIYPKELTQYAIYGDRVYSPCSGTVKKTVNGLVDEKPPATNIRNPAGNYVLMECLGVEVLLAHLMKGSVRVEEDEVVEAGEVVGRVGNSGNSSQPHLHIHAERGGMPGKILDGQGVPATLGGRFLVRNSLFMGR